MIDATQSLEAAARGVWDVIVVGAGPAGAILAQQLAPRGLRVLLMDKAQFPRGKVCGGCMNARTLAGLELAELGGLAASLGAEPLEGIEILHGTRRARLELKGAVALSREALDAGLVRAAIGAGAEFIGNVNISISADGAEGEWRVLKARDQATGEEAMLRGRLVIAADGVGSPLTARVLGSRPIVAKGARVGAGVTVIEGDAPYARGTITMACGAGGYVGIVRAEAGRVIAAAALDPAWIARCGGLGEAARGIAEACGVPWSAGLAAALWRGTAALTSRPVRLGAERLLAAGDAAGYVEPFTGEGMAWGIAGALALAPIAARAAQRWDGGCIAEWERAHTRLVRRRQWVCRAAKELLRHPQLLDAALWSAAHAPGLFAPMVHYSQRAGLGLGRFERAGEMR